MSATVIREATEADAGGVIALWTEAYVTLGVSGRAEPYEPADFAASARNGTVTVAELDGVRPAGVVVLSPPGAPGNQVAGPEEAELSRLAVAATRRGAGIGRALTELCERRARAAGWSAIALWSRPGQVEAHGLYESLGYERRPERDSVDPDGRKRLVFRLALDAAAARGAG